MVESGGDWERWLSDSVTAVRVAASDADDRRDLIPTVAEVLADEGLAQFVWVTALASDREGVQVRARSDDAESSPTLAAPDDDPTTRALEAGDILFTPAVEQTPLFSALRGPTAFPDGTAAVHVPFEAVGEAGVVHLWTSRDVSADGAREAATVFGAVLEDNLALLATEDALSRERERLESVRSTISHDLGNPVNLASGRIELAADESESPHLSHALGALREIDSMTTESVSYVQAGKRVTDREPRSVTDIVAETWAELDTGQSSLQTEPVSVRAEPERLRQLLSELLVNALAHTDGAVTVAVGPLDGRRGFFLADTGDGIPEDERPLVFDRGYTTDPERDGTGLAIAREIAAAHNWEIGLAADNGARFEIVTERW